MKPLNQKGLTLVELLAAVAILAVVATAVLSTRYYMAKRGQENGDRAFAAEKAIQMMEELKALVAGAERTGGTVSILDSYDDGANNYNPLLTTDTNVTNPGDPLSGNRPQNGGWRFLRQVSIQTMPNDVHARRVYIRVFKSASANPSLPDVDLADVGGVLRTVALVNQPTQVFDVYILSIENVPGWWSQIVTMEGSFRNIIQQIQNLNPGFQVRQHWIHRTAFGRDLQYAPYINQAANTSSAVMPWVYFYPGSLIDDNGASNEFFDSKQVSADLGRVNIDGGISNSTPFPICDMYNHAARYPDEVNYYNQAVSLAQATNQPIPEISLRMLLEEMNSAPQSFTNAMIVNLHGELLPMPAMRNYSDAAKDPANLSGFGGSHIRVVTHPEQIGYGTSSAINLRIYAYYDGMDGGSTPVSLDPAGTSVVSQMTLFFPNENLSIGNVAITAVVGNSSVTYAKVPLASSLASSMGMSWTSGITNVTGSNQLFLTLYNTPLRCPPAPDNGGLSSSNWLYGLEYIPCQVLGNGSSFGAMDLTKKTANQPKNTARWLITLTGLTDNPDSAHPYIIETRIGNDLSAGSTADNPPNLSRTYVWLGNGVVPPITEQCQFLGDPRHCPYHDVINNNGYNWYFRKVNTSDGYSGFNKTTNGWGTEKNNIDVPRYFQIFRNALLNTQAIWTTMNGFSYYYYGLGGEFGGDQAPFQNGVSFVQTPWNPASATVQTVDEILTQTWATANLQNARIVMKTDNSWYAKTWLGELYPDSQYNNWKNNGNIPTGSGNFYRVAYNSAALRPVPTTTSNNGFNRKLGTSTATEGCASFFNGASSGGAFFQHDGGPNNTQNATILPLGINLQPLFTIPLASPVSCTRPWCIDYSGGNPNPSEWSDATYSSQRTTLSIPAVATPGPTSISRLFYQSDDTNSGGTWRGSGVVKAVSGTQNFYDVVSGLSTQANVDANGLAEIGLMQLIRTYMDGGLYSASSHIVQLPLVTLTAPKATDSLALPTTIGVTWTSAWQRWGANPYTEEYAPVTNYSEAITLNYNLKYSADKGNTWYFLQDNAAAVTGIYDAAHAVTATSYTWDVSNTTQFPQGDYDVRVEAYRQSYPLHYSYHEVDDLFISR